MTQIFDQFSVLDPVRERKQIEAAVGSSGGGILTEELTSGASPISCDVTKNITYITTGGTADDEHVVLPVFDSIVDFATPEKNGTIHVVSLKVQTNASDVVKVFQSFDNSDAKINDNAGNIIGIVAGGIILDYVGAAASFVWWDASWYLYRLDREDSNGTINNLVFPDSDPHVAGAGYWSGSTLTKSTG